MKTLTTKQIRESKATGFISMSYNSDSETPNKINFSDGTKFEFENSGDRQATWNKLIRMGFQLTEIDNNPFEKWMNT
jgi:hypothetical protein